MEKIVDRWTSLIGNTVEIDEHGDMHVSSATGRVVQNAGRVVMCTQKSGMMQAALRSHAARHVEDEPLFAPVVPYFLTDTK